MGIDSIIHVIKARWGQVASIALAVMILGAVVTALMPRQYKAQASFVIDNRASELAGMPMAQSMLPASYMATQVDIVRSARVAQKALAALPAATRAALQQRHQESKSTEPFETWGANLLQSGLTVTHSRESNVVSVAYSSRDPAMSAQAANAFVDSYVRTAIELRAQPAQRYSEFFETEARAARQKLSNAQDRLSEFRRKSGISVSDERLDSENNRLNDLSKELVMLQSRSAETSNRALQARRSPERISELMNDPVLVEMRNDLQRARTTLSEQQQQLGSSHPRIIEARAAVRDLTARIREETGRLVESVEATSVTTEQRIAAIRKEIAQQRITVADLQSARSEAALLQGDVDSAQAAYNSIVRGENQSRLESRSTQGSASILEVATPPASPSSPRVLLNLFVSAFTGALLGLLYALFRESGSGRIRSETQLLELSGQPLLTSVPRFRHSARLTFDPRRSIGRSQRRLTAPR